ncbi:GNAT family N-acetyltransferase [Streptomyces sp. HC44]|uniref:GNAT family N-acetyltransferase n=1 Tax=Streptomyces scabichelini TaxID=2711217 RepID=A0A6G4VID7_9ACTN|nr:GNAT family N-acetyltransferase [Streptomyces scabichelini]NGO13533.1 GNAT family N-acetyltransferase [Streptomyces scabichelini]
MTTRLRTAHTADLTRAELRVVRAFLDDVFEGDFSDEDWDHTLGGVHALVRDGTRLVAHGAVIQRRVLHQGRSLRTGYVEGVGVRADVRRQGLGGQVMAALERVIDHAYALGALSATYEGEGLYAARGWQEWSGRIHALGPDGIVHLPDEEIWLFVRPASAGPLDPAHELVFDWRDGDVL